MKKLSKTKLGLRKEAIRVVQDSVIEDARGGKPNSDVGCTTDSLAPCTRPF